jgi:hypothetical protein
MNKHLLGAAPQGSVGRLHSRRGGAVRQDAPHDPITAQHQRPIRGTAYRVDLCVELLMTVIQAN